MVDVIQDWYLYGCVITDIDFVREFFRIVQDSLAETLKPQKVLESERLAAIILEYCSLKTSWPYCDKSRPRFGKYFFVGEDYDIARIDYDKIGAEKSPYDKILLSLSSMFDSGAELAAANAVLTGIIERFVSEYREID